MRKSPPPPHRENGTKKAPLYEKSLPPPHKREKKVPQIDCFPGEPCRQAPTLAAHLRAPMSECDYKIHNIYSTLIYIKIHSRMHPIELLKKKILGRAYPRIL